MQPFEVREAMELEHTPETDLIGCHQDLEEGERFESSDLRFDSPEGGHPLFPSFMEGTEITLSWVCFP